MPYKSRFLTYAPWSGQLNNTRMCFETALIFALLTGRTLVLPNNYRLENEPELVRGRFQPLHPQEFLDLSSIRQVIDIIPYREYAPLCGRSVHKHNVRFGVNTTVFCHPNIPKNGSVEHANLVDYAAGRINLLEFSGEVNKCTIINIETANLEHFYTFFFFLDNATAAKCNALIRDRVRFGPEISNLASMAASRLGPFSAAHIRRGDFVQQYPGQNLPIESLIANITKYATKGARLYVATDEHDLRFFNRLHDYYDMVFMADLNGLFPRKMSKASLACFEQELCSFADVFVGTRLSTFSGYVTRLRGYRNAVDKEVYFTDGYRVREVSLCGMHRYSWSSWLAAGNPLWGREYKEGWEW